MIVFLDFEASSLADEGFPVEVGWVGEEGEAEAHLIRPAPGWTDWDPAAEAIHGISRDTLEREGEPHDAVARRMVDVLAGHALCASAPSWDGKWLSLLLRAAGLPRHALRLRDSDDLRAERARALMAGAAEGPRLEVEVAAVVARARAAVSVRPPAHRAGADALSEREEWRLVERWAAERARALQG